MTFPRTVCQHTTHDRTLTFEDGIEAAAKWHDAEGDRWQESCDAAWVECVPDEGLIWVKAHRSAAAAIRALSHKEPGK